MAGHGQDADPTQIPARAPSTPKMEPGSDAVADRLDRLTSSQAESVIKRAIHLQSEAEHDESFDLAMLQDIASDLGIPLAILEQALAEQHRDIAAAQRHTPSRLDRLFGITGFDESAVLRGEIPEIENVLSTWMRSHEGMKRSRRTADGGEWHKNTQFLSQLKVDLGLTNSTPTLRNAGTTRHYFHALSDTEVLLTIEADRARVRMIAAISLAGAVALALVGAGFVGFGAGSFFGAIWTALGGLALFGGTAVGVIRGWTSRIRRSLARVIEAVTHPEESGVYETIGAKIGSLFDRFRSKSGAR